MSLSSLTYKQVTLDSRLPNVWECSGYRTNLTGLNKPVNDLSRGASAERYFNLAIITAAQALNGLILT